MKILKQNTNLLLLALAVLILSSCTPRAVGVELEILPIDDDNFFLQFETAKSGYIVSPQIIPSNWILSSDGKKIIAIVTIKEDENQSGSVGEEGFKRQINIPASDRNPVYRVQVIHDYPHKHASKDHSHSEDHDVIDPGFGGAGGGG